MERFNYMHSLKNIPTPTNAMYSKQLIAKTEEFIQRLRWKAFFFLNPNDDHAPKTTYGFKTTKTAPHAKELHDFESDLYEMINNVQFTDYRSRFQRRLINDVKNINKSDKIYLMADKTRNIYEVSEDRYNKLLFDNVTSSYQKTTQATIGEINTEARTITSELGIDDRVEQLAEKTAFITLKDHKPDFENRPKCRLINPAKSQIGKISKKILDPINITISDTLGLNQWRSTQQVLEWFNQIQSKNRKRFMQFDINEFYPSITEDLLDKALEFANSIKPITSDEINIIKHSRKSLLFTHPTAPEQNQHATPWTKKTGLFDVTMGAFDGAEICEVVGLYILHLIKNRLTELELELEESLDLDVGLYRDDGLIVHKRLPGHTTDAIRKSLVSLFKELGLGIEVSIDMAKANFLDVTLDLDNGKYGPYRKPNDQPLYVNSESNHPPAVLKQIPRSINKRLSSISSTEQEFMRAAPMYQKALTESGYTNQLAYIKPNSPTTNRKKNKRKIIWFNPPFSKSVTTNIGQKFLTLVKKHFAPGSPLYSVCNKNTIKLSYSCTKNMRAILQTHNKKVLCNTHTPTEAPCNCRVKTQCPVQGACQKPVVYKATIKVEGKEKTYIGSTNNFKARYSGHKNSFKSESNKNATALSTLVWSKGLNPCPNITWEIIRVVPPYRPGQLNCELCLAEKQEIARQSHDPDCLNKRSEIAQACRHRARFKLSKA